MAKATYGSVTLAAASLLLAPAAAHAGDTKCSCTGEVTPLPLEAKTPDDLAFKALVERHYLMVNLLTAARAATQRHDHATAMSKWEALARLPDLPPDVAHEVNLALGRAEQDHAAPDVAAHRDAALPVEVDIAPKRRTTAATLVSGRVMGGGSRGPGNTVVWLKPLDRPMPPLPAVKKLIKQKNKRFLPHVVAVPVGGRVAFVNDDEIHHNVFSSTKPNDFDSGLYGKGGAFGQVFDKAGPVEILCNIHASMNAYVYVVESPYYAVANGSGAFRIPNVPPGRYQLEAWNEGSSGTVSQKIQVGPSGAPAVVVSMAGDKGSRGPAPDKYGRPRQEHIGY